MKLHEIYTEILNEVGEGTTKPFKYEKSFEEGNSFDYIIDGFAGDKKIPIPIKLQGLEFNEDIENLRHDLIKFLSLNGSDPEGTLNGIEVIFSRMGKGNPFGIVDDQTYMFRLMATIKKILQDEFAKSKPDVLIYTPNKKGSEDVDKTGRHKLYNAFIRKAFPNARVFVDNPGEQIIYKLK